MTQPRDRLDELDTAPFDDSGVNLLVWQTTTMLETDPPEDAPDDNVLRGID
jgi:hypothetical protein